MQTPAFLQLSPVPEAGPQAMVAIANGAAEDAPGGFDAAYSELEAAETDAVDEVESIEEPIEEASEAAASAQTGAEGGEEGAQTPLPATAPQDAQTESDAGQLAFAQVLSGEEEQPDTTAEGALEAPAEAERDEARAPQPVSPAPLSTIDAQARQAEYTPASLDETGTPPENAVDAGPSGQGEPSVPRDIAPQPAPTSLAQTQLATLAAAANSKPEVAGLDKNTPKSQGAGRAEIAAAAPSAVAPGIGDAKTIDASAEPQIVDAGSDSADLIQNPADELQPEPELEERLGLGGRWGLESASGGEASANQSAANAASRSASALYASEAITEVPGPISLEPTMLDPGLDMALDGGLSAFSRERFDGVAPSSAGAAMFGYRGVETARAAGAQISAAIQQSNGQTKLEVALNPPELGKVNLELVFDDLGRVNVVIQAERGETLDLLRRHGEELAKELRDAGLDLENMSFTDGNAGEAFSEQPGDQEAPRRVGLPHSIPIEVIAPEAAGRGSMLDGRLDLRV